MPLNQLNLARYRLIFKVTQPIYLPTYAGSTLRGVFGHALRKIACMTKQKECKTCPLYQTCPYTNIFETPTKAHKIQQFSQVPNGYIIEPPEWGIKRYEINENLQFDLVLFGHLIEQLPLIIFAFKRAFYSLVAKGKGELIDVLHQQQDQFISIYSEDKLIAHQSLISLPENLPNKMTLRLQTPLRIQENGKPLREETINLERFLITLAKRFSLLNEFHAQPLILDFTKLKAELTAIEDNKQLQWQDWQRYSSRQDQKMRLGGVIGEWQLNQLSPTWQALLYWGQWLHCGKNATFGLGKYQITNL